MSLQQMNHTEFLFNRNKKLKVVGSPYWMAPEVLRHDQYNETVSYGYSPWIVVGQKKFRTTYTCGS
jgi:serine/threonine protein kinase